jgi:ABC-type glycerol-3-phosphate transport system substrate-binding protein
MKKIISALLAALVLTLALAGCGGKAVRSDLAAKDILTAAVEGTDLTVKMIDVADNQIIATYGIDLTKLEGYSVRISNSIVSANTIAVFKLKDEKDIVAVQNSVAKRKADMVATFQSYAPAESALAENAVMLTKGRYILFVVSKDAETAKAAFLKLFQ